MTGLLFFLIDINFFFHLVHPFVSKYDFVLLHVKCIKFLENCALFIDQFPQLYSNVGLELLVSYSVGQVSFR